MGFSFDKMAVILLLCVAECERGLELKETIKGPSSTLFPIPEVLPMLPPHLGVGIEHPRPLPQLLLVLLVERRLVDELVVGELLQQSLVHGQLLEHLKEECVRVENRPRDSRYFSFTFSLRIL